MAGAKKVHALQTVTVSRESGGCSEKVATRLAGSLAALALVALLIASGAVAQGGAVRVRVAPLNVTAGNTLFITASVAPAGRMCKATITRIGARAAKLTTKKAARGTVSWRWRVPRSAKSGAGTARVACTGAGTGSKRFRITALPPPAPATIPAKVVVMKNAIAQRASSIGSTFASYGIVLQNISPDEDAFRVELLVNILDAGGRILRSETDTYEEIPAGATYYAGGDSIFTGTAARLEITATVGERKKKLPITLPQVSNIRVEEDFIGEARVVGEVANTSTKTLSTIARITFVCFDSGGNAIGGGYTYPPTSLPPGARAGFSTTAEGLRASQIASVMISVEPEYT